MEFTPIETQEALNAIIKERIDREKKAHNLALGTLNEQIQTLTAENARLQDEAKKYQGYESDLAALRTKVANYETDSVKRGIADEYGLPKGMHSRLLGDSEAAWREDAAELSKLYAVAGDPPPLANPESEIGAGDATQNALRKMVKNMKGE